MSQFLENTVGWLLDEMAGAHPGQRALVYSDLTEICDIHFPPFSNWLKIPIRAGEKKYPRQ